MVLEYRDKIVALMKSKGPIIPAQIKEVIPNVDILFSSAMLSELVSRNVVKISNVKIGSSPLYYLPGQESRLQSFANKLNEKDKRTYDLLQNKTVLRDKELDMLTRVSLRQIKDFAKPLDVSIGGSKEIFWKWYLAADKDVESVIKEILTGKKESPPEGRIEEKKPEVAQEILEEKKIEAVIPERKPAFLEQKKEEIKEFKRELPERIESVQKKLVKPARVVDTSKDAFAKYVSDFFKKKNIRVIEQTLIKKNSEINYVISLPTAVGDVIYYCKAKSKKRLSDSDISSAFVQGQIKKLPVILLTPGELTAKARELLGTEFRGVSIRKL